MVFHRKVRHRALNDCYMNQKVYECMVSEMREAQKKRVEEARKKGIGSSK